MTEKQVVAKAMSLASTISQPLSNDLDAKCDELNSIVAEPKGYDCDKCKNRGHIFFVKDDTVKMRFCDCNEIRKTMRMIERSGLSEAIKRLTFDSYQVIDKWQKVIKDKAIEFCKSDRWFYIGGGVGTGKSHICTAITADFLSRRIPAKYMLWRDEVSRLTALATSDEERQVLLEPLKTIKVLYIDDFFKKKRGEQQTNGEINIAFEIINYRYINRLTTIISSEYTIEEVCGIDEALGSRIYEMCKPNYAISIDRDVAKNYRLR